MQYADIILSARVDVYADFLGIPFVAKMKPEHAQKVVSTVSGILPQKSTQLKESTNIEKLLLFEDGILETRASLGEEYRVMISRSANIHAVLNEVEHFRISAVCRPDWIRQGLAMAWGIREQLREIHPFVQDPEIGCLTSSPALAGSGCRVSAVMHLPMLKRRKKISELKKTMEEDGVTLEPFWKESDFSGCDLFYVRSRALIGNDPQMSCRTVREWADHIADMEQKARDDSSDDPFVMDFIMRSNAILHSAVLMSQKEFLSLWSGLVLGSSMKLLPFTLDRPLTFMKKGLDGHIAARISGEISQDVCSKARCEWLKEKLLKGEV